MPKASKKKGAKEADFKKAKVKLGKGKQQASNATNTSFKARSIALPNQTPIDRALQDPSGEAITSNGLTLEEVLFRFRHPNSGVRREAIGGVREILVQKPAREVGKVCRVMGAAISDEDAGVRKALLGFFGWYLATVPTSTLTPHLPLLQLQTSSALSHIFPEIRLDAARLVHLFLDHIPSHITSSWPAADSTIMEGLRLTVGLGNDKGVSTQGGRLGAQGKLVTLKTILAFLRTALKDTAGGSVEDMFAAQFDREGSSHAGKGKGKARQVGEHGLDEQYEGSLVGCGEWGIEEALPGWELGRLEATSSLSGKEVEIETLTQLYTSLHPLLLSTFLEAAPSAFSPSTSSFSTTDNTSLELCTVTAALSEILSRSILSSEVADIRTVRANASDFLKRMAAWFPFSNPATATSSSTGVSPAFELSLTYSKLAILLAPRPKILVFPKGKKEVGWKLRIRATEESWKTMRSIGKGKGKQADGWALEEVSEWIISVLAPQDALTPGMTPTAYQSILSLSLPLILLPPTSDISSSIAQALLSHLSRQGSSSQIKSLGNQFFMALVLAHEVRFPSIPFFIPPQSPLRQQLKQWLENLTKTLWEIGIKDPSATQRILAFLLTIGQRGEGAFEEGFSIVPKDVFGVIAARLGPWFWLEHPSKGGIKGPWTKSDKEVKKLGLDVATIWSAYDSDSTLTAAVGKAVEVDEWAKAYWIARSRS